MAVSKAYKFDQQQNTVAGIAKALAHPARIAIIQHIASRESCICNDLVEELPLSQSTISQHLNELKRVGLIKGEVDGPKICYCIDMEVWEDAKQAIQMFFDENVPGCSDDCC